MARKLRSIALSLLAMLSVTYGPPQGLAKEYLTPEEITKIQEAREIDQRVKIYMEAAALRLKTAEDRLRGRESEPGDSLEFFTIEEMMEGYNRILRSVMFNIDELVEKRQFDRGRMNKALKNLKESTEKSSKDLAILKKLAEEKLKEEFWNLVNSAMEITEASRQGAELGLQMFSSKNL